MAIQGYIGWARGVNRVILDSTSITTGNNALLEEETESLNKQSMQRGNFVPDEYSVTMSFDWVNEVVIHHYDQNGNIVPHLDEHLGKTEYQIFMDWYKYRHKYGSVPFEFPKILYSPNTGIKIYDTVDENIKDVEFYKITSAVTGNKSGEHVEVTMTWKSVYEGTVSVPVEEPGVVDIDAHSDYVDINFSAISDTAPVSSQFTIYNGNSQIEKTGFYYDNYLTVRIYYATQAVGSTISFSCSYSGLVVEKGDYESEIRS